MARERRQFKGFAKACTLGSDITAASTTITLVGDPAGWPDGSTGKFPIIIDRAGTQEAALGNARSGATVTLASSSDRGVDDTTAAQHTAGVSIEHGSIRRDYDEANELVAATAGNSCRVYNNANIAVSPGDGTALALTFNSERFDTGALHSTSANTGRLTCVTAGKYLICGTIAWDANSTGYRQMLIRLNGSTIIANSIVLPPSGAVQHPMTVSTVYALAAADYVELVVAQNSGGSLNVLVLGNQSPEFGMAFVGF